MRSLLRLAGVIVLLALGSASAEAAFERGLEKTLGKQARDAIESQYEVVRDDPEARYVERLGAALVEVSPRHDLQYAFRILDTEQINAFALPWGYVYVTTGMLRFVDSSDELAGVLGHEIAHVAEKHSLDAFKKQFWASLLFGAIDAPATLMTAGQVGATFYLLRYSRKDEQAADRLGTGYAYAAGYDPQQLAAFLRKLDREQGRKLSAIEVYLATHPTGERRQERLAELPQMNPRSPEVAERVAAGLAARHLANQAVVEYRRAIELAPHSAAAHAGLARAYAELGEMELARDELRRAAQDGAARPEAAVAATTGGLATQAPRSTGSEQAPPVPDKVAGRGGQAPSAPPSQADEEQISRVRAAAGAWQSQLQEPTRQIRDRAKSLDKQVRDLSQRMSMSDAFGRATAASDRIAEKAALALYLIADTSDRVGAIAGGLEAAGNGAPEIADLVARGAAAAGGTEREQWLALTADIAAGLGKANERSGEAQQQALQAADLAAKAASQLSSAMGSLPSSLGAFGSLDRGLAFTGLAEGELDDALRNARAAREASQKAMAMLSEWRASELKWRLSAAYLETPSAQRAAVRSVAAAMMAVDAQALEPMGAEGFGGALVRTMKPPAQKSEPVSADKGSTPQKAAQASAGDSDLMLKLVLADITREAQARKQWQGAPESPPGVGGTGTTRNP